MSFPDWRSLFTWLTRGPREHPAPEDVGEQQSPSFDPMISLDAILSVNPIVREKSRGLLAQRLMQLRPAEVIGLDERIRKATYPRTRWARLDPQAVADFATNPEATALLCVASCHANGYIRQAALKQMANRFDPVILPFALVRISDWVKPVRTAAQQLVAQWLRPPHITTWVGNLVLLDALNRRTRGSYQELGASVARLVSTDPDRKILVAGLFSKDAQTSRASFRLLTRIKGEFENQMLRRALRAPDAFLRQSAAAALLRRTPATELEALVRDLLTDPAVAVRRIALQFALDALHPDSFEFLHLALLDPHATIRELGRFYSSRIAGITPRGLYLERLVNAPDHERWIAIRGIGETGSKEDFDKVRPYLAAEDIRTRKATLTAAAQLWPEAALPYLLEALQSELSGVSRQAQRLLSGARQFTDFDQVVAAYRTAPIRHVRRNAFRLVGRLPKWDRLPILLEATRDRDPQIARRAVAGLSAWVAKEHRSYITPSAEQLSAAQNQLAELPTNAPNHLQLRLREVLALVTRTME